MLCCNEKAQEHFSRFAQAFSAWDGTPAIIRPRDVLKIVEALPIGSRSMDELIAAFAVWAGGTPGAVNVRRVEYELLPPDNYVRHMAGRIAPGDSFDRVRGDLQSAGRGFGIIRLEAQADTIVYRMGNATRWVEAYETEYGNPPIMLSGRDDMIRTIETGVWQGLPTQFQIDPSMYEEECELRFDVASKTIIKNSCPAVDSSFDPDLTIEDAFVRRNTGLSTDEKGAAQNQTVAWLRYVDGKLQSKVGPKLDSRGRLIDISGSDLLPPAIRDELPLPSM